MALLLKMVCPLVGISLSNSLLQFLSLDFDVNKNGNCRQHDSVGCFWISCSCVVPLHQSSQFEQYNYSLVEEQIHICGRLQHNQIFFSS